MSEQVHRVIAIAHGFRDAIRVGRLGKRSLVDFDTLERLLDAEEEAANLKAAIQAAMTYIRAHHDGMDDTDAVDKELDRALDALKGHGPQNIATDVHGQKWIVGPGYAEPLED